MKAVIWLTSTKVNPLNYDWRHWFRGIKNKVSLTWAFSFPSCLCGWGQRKADYYVSLDRPSRTPSHETFGTQVRWLECWEAAAKVGGTPSSMSKPMAAPEQAQAADVNIVASQSTTLDLYIADWADPHLLWLLTAVFSLPHSLTSQQQRTTHRLLLRGTKDGWHSGF